MRLNEIKEQVLKANLALVEYGLVKFTWGNASVFLPEKGWVVIKPSGVSYAKMKAEDMVVVDLEGNLVEGNLMPSSDLLTHLELYKKFEGVLGIVHTHSTYATAWAQAGIDIPILGTTHADYFHGDIPCTRTMTEQEVFGAYEKETGKVIVERFEGLNCIQTPAVIVNNHGPFTWGRDVDEAVHNSVVLEELAHMAYVTASVQPKLFMNAYLVEKHFSRKHGANAYYGQKKKNDE